MAATPPYVLHTFWRYRTFTERAHNACSSPLKWDYSSQRNSFKAKLARQHDISKSTLTNRINDRKAASARNQHFQRLSPEEEAAIRDWILRLQTWGWPSRVKQVRSIAKELLIKRGDNKSVEVNWPQKFLKRHSQIKTVSAQQTKVWNKKSNDLLRLGSELFTSTSMTVSSRQKKKKQLIVKLQVRQLKLKRKQNQNQNQNQNQKQRNNVISITDQSGRCMRIKRVLKRFY